jgi:predicted secreted protein
MSNAWWVYGSSLQMGDGEVSEAFTTIAEVRDINPPQPTRDAIEVTNQDSTDGWREFISGWRDGNELVFDANWLPTNATQDGSTGLWEQFNDDELHNYKLILPDTLATVTFAGFIQNFDPDMALENQGELSVNIKISGKVTIT